MSDWKTVYTDMLEKCFTIYQQVKNLKNIVVKIGEVQDGINEDNENINNRMDEIDAKFSAWENDITYLEELITMLELETTYLTFTVDAVVEGYLKANEIKVGEDISLTSSDETLKVDKSLKFGVNLLNNDETFDVDENGNVSCTNIEVSGEVKAPTITATDTTTTNLIFSDSTTMDSAPHLYAHDLTIFFNALTFYDKIKETDIVLQLKAQITIYCNYSGEITSGELLEQYGPKYLYNARFELTNQSNNYYTSYLYINYPRVYSSYLMVQTLIYFLTDNASTTYNFKNSYNLTFTYLSISDDNIKQIF